MRCGEMMGEPFMALAKEGRDGVSTSMIHI
jgi:hypothetical protein